MLDEKHLDQDFWNNQWIHSETGWDVGYATPPIVEFMKKYPKKEDRILIPGCGNAYEAKFLINNSFKNIHLIDIAPKAVENLTKKFEDVPQIKIFCQDFFQHEDKYDLLIEQTFFCALSPSLREAYVAKSASLLKSGGQIIGVLFDRFFEKQGPPFGGNKKEYINLFEKFFEIKVMERCYNSIPQRLGSEVFIQLVKK